MPGDPLAFCLGSLAFLSKNAYPHPERYERHPVQHSVRLLLVGFAAALSLLAASCGTDDDGANVREIGASEDGSQSASASSSGSSSAPASSDDDSAESTAGDGGYEYATNVDSHRLVVADICAIGEPLDAADYTAVETIYRNGINSVKDDGSIRTIAGFASRDDRNPALQDYYGTQTPLDDFVSAALAGTGPFEGAGDDASNQGIEKGIQNQIMIAWSIHEQTTALGKAADGDFEGAVHNWDEAWAFFHGSEPGCAPYATGNKRADNFATVGADGETALANEAILAAMIAGRDALVAEDTGVAKTAADEVLRNIVITYSQAAIRYASLIEGDIADGDAAKAKVHQAEGLAFWRVIEAYAGPAGADTDAVNAIYNLANEPGTNGFGDDVRAALEPAWEAMDISVDDIGTLQ